MNRILKSPQLPSAPSVALRLLELAQDLDSSTHEVVETLKTDPALAVKILRAANSTAFGCRSEITILDQAVTLVGRTVITTLALSSSLSAEAMHDPEMSHHYQRYWLRSIVQASAAETLAHCGSPLRPGELFMTGLLVDLGQLAMLKTLRHDYAALLGMCQDDGLTLCELERQQFGFTHSEVGVALMENWKLPQSIVTATKYHHCQSHGLPDTLGDCSLVHAIMVASATADYICAGNPSDALQRLRTFTSSCFNMTEEQLMQYLTRTDARTKQAALMYSANVGQLPSAADMMAQAADQLAEIAIRQNQEQRTIVSQQQLAERRRLELEALNQKLQQQAIRDPLTNVFNRRYFDDMLESETRRATRAGGSVAILLLDVDHFKSINDAYGHAGGDACLVNVARILESCARTTDVVARYGGEEFVVLALDTDEAGLNALAERIRRSIEAATTLHHQRPISCTVSIGGAIAIPDRDDTDFGAQLRENADAAMYESKRKGRNCVTVRSMVHQFDRFVSSLILANRFSHWLVNRQIITEIEAHEFAHLARPRPEFIGELASRRHWLNADQIQCILRTQDYSAERFGFIACDMGLLNHEQLAVLLAEQAESAELIVDHLREKKSMDHTEALALLNQFYDERSQRLASTSTSIGPVSSLP